MCSPSDKSSNYEGKNGFDYSFIDSQLKCNFKFNASIWLTIQQGKWVPVPYGSMRIRIRNFASIYFLIFFTYQGSF